MYLLNFLSAIIVLWLCGRMTLFIQDTSEVFRVKCQDEGEREQIVAKLRIGESKWFETCQNKKLEEGDHESLVLRKRTTLSGE